MGFTSFLKQELPCFQLNRPKSGLIDSIVSSNSTSPPLNFVSLKESRRYESNSDLKNGLESNRESNLDATNSDDANSRLKSKRTRDYALKTPTADGLECIFKLTNEIGPGEKPYEPSWKCTQCGQRMDCLEFKLRPSWKIILATNTAPFSSTVGGEGLGMRGITQTMLCSMNEPNSLRESERAMNSESSLPNPESSPQKNETNPPYIDSS